MATGPRPADPKMRCRLAVAAPVVIAMVVIVMITTWPTRQSNGATDDVGLAALGSVVASLGFYAYLRFRPHVAARERSCRRRGHLLTVTRPYAPDEIEPPGGPVAALAPSLRTRDGRLYEPRFPLAPSYGDEVTRTATDWLAFTDTLSTCLAIALGGEMAVTCREHSIVLRHGREAKVISLRPLLAPPPSSETEPALRACTKALDDAQAFRIHELRTPWPMRNLPVLADAGDLGTVHASLLRPQVAVGTTEIQLAYTDEIGPARLLAPIPWDGLVLDPDGQSDRV